MYKTTYMHIYENYKAYGQPREKIEIILPEPAGDEAGEEKTSEI